VIHFTLGLLNNLVHMYIDFRFPFLGRVMRRIKKLLQKKPFNRLIKISQMSFL